MGAMKAGLQRALLRIEIEDHDVAAASGSKTIHSVSIRLEQDLEILSKSRRKKGVQGSVFREQSNFRH